MTGLTFMIMSGLQEEAEVLSMMQALYAEDEADTPVDPSRFAGNLKFLAAHPSRGSIVLFRERDAPVGYALLVPYWSNEFGGTLMFVDEMFVVPEARRTRIGTSFLNFIDKRRPFEAVALALEVSPRNAGARRLYESLGFCARENTVLTRRLGVLRKRRLMLVKELWRYPVKSMAGERISQAEVNIPTCLPHRDVSLQN